MVKASDELKDENKGMSSNAKEIKFSIRYIKSMIDLMKWIGSLMIDLVL